MAWTQTHRHLQISSAYPDLATSIVQQAELIESLLGMALPDSVWDITALMPTPSHYPSPYHQDQREQSYRQRQLALYCGFRYSITIINPQAGLAIGDWIGQSLSLQWSTGDASLPSQLRHGVITEAVALGSNQGQAAYRIICEPDLNQLRLNSHNRRHHHLSLSELITDIMASYNIDIEIDERLSDCHIQHSVQYNQTDLAYLTQNLALYGITGYYRHDSATHTLVLIPHDHEDINPDAANINSILSQNPANLADRQDRITVIRPHVAQHLQQIQLHRYDNRLRANYTGSHNSNEDAKHHTQHQRFMHSHSRFDDQGLNDLATRYQHYQQQRAYQGELTGNLRHLMLPRAHRIDGNPYLTEPISLSAIHHRINNHIATDWLGTAPFDPITLQPSSKLRTEPPLSSANNSNNSDEVHHITACYQPYPYQHHIPYGEQLIQLGQPHSSLTGLMSASIIDNNHSAITTDRNHRAHIHYHWQSDQDSNDASGDRAQWIPIASHLVAEHMGQTHPLRHGQQVLIDFIGGDINHPIIIGSTHNGQGNTDAQHNSIASDTDFIDATSPAWFINQSHAHPIDGIKTQSIDSSRTGDASKDSLTNGYNQFIFDTYAQSSQINAYSSSYQSSLTLGHLYQHTDHARGQARGQGISIETQAAGTLQGCTGIHISSCNASSTSKQHMSHNSHSKLQTADQHQQAYQQLAETHQPVGLDNASKRSQPIPTPHSNQSNNDTNTPYAKISKDSNDTVLSKSGQWQAPHIMINAKRHLAIMSGQHSQHSSSKSMHSHATNNTHYHSQTQLNQLVTGDIHYYSNKAQTHTAAHGDVTIQAHQSQMRLDSEQTLRIHSRSTIDIIVPDTLTIKAAGSGIELSGGNVTFITPAQVGYKAAKVDWGAGGGSDLKNVVLRQAKIIEGEKFYLKYKAEDKQGNLLI
jgi:type VI secretion system secreted protein VgrG